RIESDLGIGIFDRTQSVSLVELRRQVHVAIDEPRKDEFLAKIDKLTARRRIDEAARHRLDPLAFDKNALLRFGLFVWIGEQNASGNNLRLRGPSRIVCHGLFRPKLTIFCVTAPTDQQSPPKSDNPGPRVPSRFVLEFDWHGLRLDEDTWSGSKVNRVIGEFLGQALPSVDFAHSDLT